MSPLVLTITLIWENMGKLCWVFRMVHTQARGSFPGMHLTVKRFNPTRAHNLGSLCKWVSECVCAFQIEREREREREVEREGAGPVCLVLGVLAPSAQRDGLALGVRIASCCPRGGRRARVSPSAEWDQRWVSERAAAERGAFPRPPSFRAAASPRVGPPLLRFGIQLNFTSLSRVFLMLGDPLSSTNLEII